MKPVPARQPRVWILVIFAAGIAYLLWLQMAVSEGVFFNGDSGLKALVSQNLANGHRGFDLALADPPWVRELWQNGLFPYEEPFVYRLNWKYFITFPFTFSLVTAPFFAAFGYRGLYAIPVFSTIATWLVYLWLCRKLDLSPAAAAVGLFFLIFASNLSIFSATYWEHTLSVGLAFGGLALLIPAKGAPRTGAWHAAGAGALTGLAVWFRPEQIFLVAYLSAVALYSAARAAQARQTHPLPVLGSLPDALGRRGWAYLVSAAGALALYGALNWLIYHNAFGVHSIQVLVYKSLAERAAVFARHLQQMTVGDTSFFLFNPLSLMVIGYLLFALAWQNRVKFERDWALWYVFCPLFLLGVSALVPPGSGGKQWGPRFLLLLAPITVLLFAWLLDRALENPNRLPLAARRVGLASLLLIGVVGLVQDPLRGRDYLALNYDNVRPAAEALRADPQPVIAISNKYLSQVFQPALGRSAIFVFVENDEELARLDQALLDQGHDSFSYICYSFDCKLFEGDADTRRVEQGGVKYIDQAVTVNDYGKYTVRKVRVNKSP